MTDGRPAADWHTHEALMSHTLAQLPPGEGAAWQRWLTRHQLDPARIPLHTWVVADDLTRTVTAAYWVSDPDTGRPRIDRDGWPVTVAHVVQLEASALPMPTGYTIITKHTVAPIEETA